MKRVTPETQVQIYKLMLTDYEKQLQTIRENRPKYTAQEYRKETGIFYNLIAQAKKQLHNLHPAAIPETPEEPPKLCVCERCLMAIESREGQQITRKIYVDDDAPRPCDWCEESDFDTLYEIQ